MSKKQLVRNFSQLCLVGRYLAGDPNAEGVLEAFLPNGKGQVLYLRS